MARTPRSTSGRSTARKRPSPAAGVRASETPAETAESPPLGEPAAASAGRTRSDRPSRIVLTGGTGFIGGAVARVLRDRGDVVVALVRDSRRASALNELGAELIEDDLSDVGRLADAFAGADAVIHAAGMYRIGIRRSDRGAMWDANVGATTRLLDAAERAGTPRIVYLSTVNVFGNTRGRTVDESYRRNLAEGFLSWYDETKYGAHEVAEQRIAGGAPIVLALPGTVIGPGDHSDIGAQLLAARDGRLRYLASAEMGITATHVDDAAAGIVGALDRGLGGRSYILAGECIRLRDALAIAAEVGGRRLPPIRIPDGVLRAMAPFGALIGRPNLAETVAASAGVTYWATSQRAVDELGWTPRDARAAIRETLTRA